MPYPNEHAARVKEPGLFIPDSFRSKDIKTGIRIIVGKLKGEDAMTVQAYRFSVNNFTPEEAKKWLKDHDVSYIKFEAASKPEAIVSDALQHVGILGMHWGHRKADTSSSEHKVLTTIKKKKLKDMTDDEIRTAATRIKLLNEFKSSGARSKKKPKEMTNEELSNSLTRQKLVNEAWTSGVRRKKSIHKMTDAEVKATLDRHLLEKEYKQIAGSDYVQARKLILALLGG